MPHASIDRALAALRRGEFVVVADDVTRENEGDLIAAAERVTPEAVAFMVRHTSGVLCVALPEERLSALALPLMVADNAESQRTAFTVSVDLRHGVSTGISAADRSATIRALADPSVGPSAFVRPGHVFPLRAHPRGVLGRRGHTEAAADLTRLAGLAKAGVLSELIAPEGDMLRGRELERFAEEHSLAYVTIGELAAYRRSRESIVEHIGSARLPTRHGVFVAHAYRSAIDGREHLALVRGQVSGASNVLTRVHSECATGDIFGSVRCDCGEQLSASLRRVVEADLGVVVYLRGHEGRGIGLGSKLHAYELQDRGLDTVQANIELGLPVDSRSYDVGAQILTDLGVTTIRLMSNNPAKFTELEGYRLKVVERVPLVTEPTPENVRYLRSKQSMLGHSLGLSELEDVSPPSGVTGPRARAIP